MATDKPKRNRKPKDMNDPITRKIAVLQATRAVAKALAKVPEELREAVLVEAAEMTNPND